MAGEFLDEISRRFQTDSNLVDMQHASFIWMRSPGRPITRLMKSVPSVGWRKTMMSPRSGSEPKMRVLSPSMKAQIFCASRFKPPSRIDGQEA